MMTIATLPKVASGPSVEDRMDLAKKANEEIGALVTASKGLHKLNMDDLERQFVIRGLMARIEQLSNIAWSASADVPEDFDEMKACVEFLGPI